MNAVGQLADNSADEDMLLLSIIDDLSMEKCFEMHYNVSLNSGMKKLTAVSSILMTSNHCSRLTTG